MSIPAQTEGAIPPRLETPSTSRVPPPVISKAQHLPYGSLLWEDFERLCLRLARARSNVERCHLYGVQGDDQEGIDLFARVSGSSDYSVYQCKREKEFGPARIKEAVDKFIDGNWAAKTSVFHLCTQVSLRNVQRSDEVERQRERLRAEKKTLEIWDEDELDRLLKDQPEIVDDFFGRAWVRAFNGADAAEKLGTRLDAEEMRRFREEFAKLYLNIFRRNDPRFDFLSPDAPSRPRYSLPDILAGSSVWEERREREPLTQMRLEPWAKSEGAASPQQPTRFTQQTIERRLNVESWLTARDASLVVGGPGSGKSTLLRLITLDLLSSAPQMTELARKWGTYLPVWLPFGRWTESRQKKSDDVPFKAFLKEWLELWSASDLFPLVEKALADKRLLLLVDGLDEWTHEDVASTTVDLLAVFVQQRKVPLIATSRPRTELRELVRIWPNGELAPLSKQQQLQISVQTLRGEQKNAGEQSRRDDIPQQAEEFLRAVERNPDLIELARTPLLLTLLAELWQNHVELPANRFKAYTRLVDLLLLDHPARRRRVAQRAGMAEESDGALLKDQLRLVMTHFALRMQEQHGAGVITRDAAVRILEEYLKDEDDGMGMDTAEARRSAAKIITHVTDEGGLLVARSPREVGFYHRTLQESLASDAIAAKGSGERGRIIEEHALEPRWREVLLGVAALARGKEDLQAFIDAVNRRTKTILDEYDVLPMLTELPFVTEACPPKTARQLVQRALKEIETGHYRPMQKRLLETVVRGLRPGPVQEIMRGRFSSWFPRRPEFREGFYQALGEWPVSDELLDRLELGLGEERDEEARAAAFTYGKFAKSSPATRERMLQIVQTSTDPRRRALVFDGLLRNEVALNNKEVEKIIGDEKDGDLGFADLRWRVFHGVVDQSDLDRLMSFASWGYRSTPLGAEVIPELLVQAWPGSEEIKRVCVDILTKGLSTPPEKNTARQILLRGYCSDKGVVDALASELEMEFVHYEIETWKLFPVFAPQSSALLAAVDNRIARHIKHWEVDMYWAAITTRSKEAKCLLLEKLGSSASYWLVRALLVGWGINDGEVSGKLASIIHGSPKASLGIVRLLPEMILDTRACHNHLVSLLSIDAYSPDVVVDTLASVRSVDSDPETVSVILNSMQAKRSDEFRKMKSSLIKGWPDDPRVAALAAQELDQPQAALVAVAHAAKRLEELRAPLLKATGLISTSFRSTAIETVSDIYGDEFLSKLLSRSTEEYDAEVSIVCSISKYRNKQGHEDAVRTLSEEIVNDGWCSEVRQAAAFCGLLEINRFDIFINSKKLHEKEPARLNMMWRSVQNAPLWRQVIKHWRSVKESVDELSGRMHYGPEYFWDEVSIHASAGDEASVGLLGFIDKQTTGEYLTVNIIRLLETTGFSRKRLSELCFQAIEPPAKRPDTVVPLAFPSAQIALFFGRAFSGDSAIYSRLSARVPGAQFPSSLAILALCVGWPGSDEVDRMYQLLKHGQIEAAHLIEHAIGLTRTNPEVLLRNAEQFSSTQLDMHGWERLVAAEFLTARLQRDDAAFDAVLHRAQQSELDRRTFGILVRLLTAARGLPTELRPRVESLLVEELSGDRAPAVILDPTTGEERPLSHCLLDIR